MSTNPTTRTVATVSRSRPLRPRAKRSKTGCSCCRIRRKKCDEEKPTCSSCTRLGLLCSWPDPNEFAWRIRMGLPSEHGPGGDHEEGESACSRSTKTPSSPTKATPALPSPRSLAASTPGLFPGSESMSLSLIQLYIEQTTSYMLSTPESFRDPFIHDVVPLAFEDPLVMDAMLSLGGIPVTLLGGNDSLELKRLHHYGNAIKGLKGALTRWNEGSSEGSLRLLLTTVLLCQHEVLRGNKRGVFSYHLRACRLFAPEVVATMANPRQEGLAQVLLEMYAYMELSSTLHLSATTEDVDSVARPVLSLLSQMQQHPTFGTLFGCASSLYELIPEIRRLADNRKKELALGADLGCQMAFFDLSLRLALFDGSTAIPTGPSSNESRFLRGKTAAGTLVQTALQMFLDSAYLDADLPALREIVSPLVDTAIDAMAEIEGTVWRNPVYWPRVVVGSYACTAEQKRRVFDYLVPNMDMTLRAREMLQSLWDSPDDFYGLDGLARVVELHYTNYCFG